MLDQRGGGQVPEDLGGRGDALGLKSMAGNPVGHVRIFLSL
jgi:hypothetical protein